MSASEETLWFLGTVARIKLDARDTGGRFALWEGILPRGASPPLHSHPEDETFYVLEGQVTVWVVEPELASGDGDGDGDGDGEDPPAWVATHARACGVGAAVYAAGGTPHTFRVESDTAKMLFLSAPAGIEEFVRGLSEPAEWPWLPPPPDGPRVPADRMATVERETGVIRYAPPPPALVTVNGTRAG